MVGSPLPGFGGCASGLWAGITLAGGKHNPSSAARQAPRSCGHSRSAGMTCFNHPACSRQVDSGLRRNDGGGWGQKFVRNRNGTVGMARNAFPPPSSFQRRLESRRAGQRVKGWQGLSDGTFGHRACGCHSRYAGMTYFNHWIPACAGMTAGVEVRNSAEIAKGLSGWRQTYFGPRRHSSLPASGGPALLPVFRLTPQRGGRAGFWREISPRPGIDGRAGGSPGRYNPPRPGGGSRL